MSGSITAPSPSNVWATGIIWPPLCAIVVALRFYTRRVQGARLLQDDWLTVPAIVSIVTPRVNELRLMPSLTLDADIWVMCYTHLW